MLLVNRILQILLVTSIE